MAGSESLSEKANNWKFSNQILSPDEKEGGDQTQHQPQDQRLRPQEVRRSGPWTQSPTSQFCDKLNWDVFYKKFTSSLCKAKIVRSEEGKFKITSRI